MLGPTEGLRCLDLGSDNGVVSLLLRERGGSWASGDLTEEAVGSIRSLVGEDVHLVRGDRLPFPDASFDRVAVVDMLEHVPDDAVLRRRARAGDEAGRPPRASTRLTSSRPCCGGCVTPSARPTRSTGTSGPATRHELLRDLLGPAFAVERHRTYSRFFSEAVDTALNWGMERLGKKSSAKGMVVTGDDLARHREDLPRLLRLVYPFVWAVTRLDALVPASGYMLIASARRRAS